MTLDSKKVESSAAGAVSISNTSPPPPAADAPKKMSNLMKFVVGGMSGMGATMVVQPLDLVKTRMQVSGVGGAAKEYKNSFDCIKTVIKKEGPTKLYAGIGAALLRQATYTTGRLGVYTFLNDTYKQKFEGDPNLITRMGMGVTAGACGAVVGCPAEVALIRMTADGRLPLAERRNYTSVVNALGRITSEEGFAALFRGCIPTMGRAMVVNMAQLSSYSQAKEYFVQKLEMKDGIQLHFCASMVSGFITTVASMPVDIAKTRIQNMKIIDGKPEYKGALDVLVRITRQEGVLALWKGFTPYFCRLGPHTVLTFIFLEQLNQLYSKHVLGVTGTGSGL